MTGVSVSEGMSEPSPPKVAKFQAPSRSKSRRKKSGTVRVKSSAKSRHLLVCPDNSLDISMEKMPFISSLHIFSTEPIDRTLLSTFSGVGRVSARGGELLDHALFYSDPVEMPVGHGLSISRAWDRLYIDCTLKQALALGVPPSIVPLRYRQGRSQERLFYSIDTGLVDRSVLAAVLGRLNGGKPMTIRVPAPEPRPDIKSSVSRDVPSPLNHASDPEDLMSYAALLALGHGSKCPQGPGRLPIVYCCSITNALVDPALVRCVVANPETIMLTAVCAAGVTLAYADDQRPLPDAERPSYTALRTEAGAIKTINYC